MRKLTQWSLVVVLAAFTLGAQAQSKSKLEQDLEDLRTWMNRKASQADSLTRAEWPAIKQEFKERTSNLDRGASRMSEKSKKEYTDLKSTYQNLEAKNEEAYGQPLNREEALRWEIELVGTSAIGSITAAEMRDTFTYFMEQVRNRRVLWSLRDWDYAEHVYLQLSNRKQVLLDQMNNSDKIKVAALQVEFNTLRKSRDVRDKLDSKKEKQ